MKQLLFLSLLIYTLNLSAQTINVRFYDGVAPYTNSFWNNWKVKGAGRDTSAAFTDLIGNVTKIRAVLDDSGTPFDNGTGYIAGQTMLPDTVIRKGIYKTNLSNFTLIGLDDSAKYNLVIYPSRNRADSQTTLYVYAKDTISVLSNNNATRSASYVNLRSTGGQLNIKWFPKNGYAYLNAFTLTVIPKTHPTAKIVADSTTISSPNSVVHLNGAQSLGKIVSQQWFQVSGPTKAIFTGDTAYRIIMSGLFPGTYKFELYVTDSLLNSDSATVTILVKPVVVPAVDSVAIGKAYLAAHPCPGCPPPIVCPICPVCPPPRTATITLVYVNGVPTLKIVYSDGTIQ